MSGSLLEEVVDPFKEIASISILDLFREMHKSFKETHFEQKIQEEIGAQRTCTNSLVPQGRVWCSYYNGILSGRCNIKCTGYSLKK